MFSWLSDSQCQFCGHRTPTDECTDGRFAWTDILIHYVADHDVWLPDEVVAHMLRPGTEPIAAISTRDIVIDYQWWKQQPGWNTNSKARKHPYYAVRVQILNNPNAEQAKFINNFFDRQEARRVDACTWQSRSFHGGELTAFLDQVRTMGLEVDFTEMSGE